MPPKPSKKTEQKQKEKVIEDKTFGLKNKKGSKQQKFVKMVQHQVKNPNQSAAKLEAQKHEKKSKPDELADITKLLKPVTAMPKVDKDVDPKSVLCVFYKQGMCHKGDKCKFSHDLEIQRKAEKKNIYVDKREDEEKADTMDDWDESTLLDVVDKKHAEEDKNKPRTAIICKFFLQALDDSKYGWFWECPNGDKCIYRHAVPPDYVCKKDRVKIEQVNKEDEITLEDLIEKERAALGSNLTKITFETFCAWKKRKLLERQRERAKEEKRKRTELKAGKDTGLSGRELFTYNPDLVTQDDEEADETKYAAAPVALEEGQKQDESEGKVIDESMFMNGYNLPGGSNSLDIDEDLFNEDVDLPEEDEEENSNGEGNDDNESASDQEDDQAATSNDQDCSVEQLNGDTTNNDKKCLSEQMDRLKMKS